MVFPPIADHAVLGNGRTLALVTVDGVVNWLCLPRIDGEPVFDALLDADRGGRFSVSLRGATSTSRRYEPGTAVLHRSSRTAAGHVEFVECIHAHGGPTELEPDFEFIRKVVARHGDSIIDIVVDPRPDFGRGEGRFRRLGANRYAFESRSSNFVITSTRPLEIVDGGARLAASWSLAEADEAYVVMSQARVEPSPLPVVPAQAESALVATTDWWRRWSSGIHLDEVDDSMLRDWAVGLKLLCYPPSGAIYAAGTTSLPEWPGGGRNWDYRFCWLRDASLSIRALLHIGSNAEAGAFFFWLFYATQITRPRLEVLYDVHGRTSVAERVIPNVPGYRGSTPVRVGNGAVEQLQLDTYGALLDAAYVYVEQAGGFGRKEQKMLLEFGESAAELWREPDQGIWEKRGPPLHHTLSKAMCWVALDRLIALDRDGWLKAPVRRFEEQKAAIRAEIEQRGWCSDENSYSAQFDRYVPDASLLLLALYGYADPAGERMQGTYRALARHLQRNGHWYRYPHGRDGFEDPEGSFGLCGFWAVQFLAACGRIDEAEAQYERLLDTSSPDGMFSEQYDPASGTMLGNFPQAFTHVGAINAACELAAAKRRLRGGA